MKANRTLIAWNPGQDVAVGPLLSDGDADWTTPYRYTGGAAYRDRYGLDGWASVAMVFVDFNTLVLRDKVPAQAVHEAFLAIDEYAEHIATDIRGAR